MSKIAEWFSSHTETNENAVEDDEFLQFDRVQDPPSQRRDICAFLLLDKLVPGKGDIIACAEHDQIWLDVAVDDLEDVATEDDIIYLLRCGVWYDDGEDCLCMWT